MTEQTDLAARLRTCEAALTAQSQTNAELLRRLAEAGVGWTLSVAAFRSVLLDITDKGMTIRDLRMRLFLARKEQPPSAMEPSEVAAYINRLVTGGQEGETLSEERT